VKSLACCVIPDKKLYGNCLYWYKYVRDSDGTTQWLKATVPDRRVWIPTPACVIVAVRLSKALRRALKSQAVCTSVRSASAEDYTSGTEIRTQNACASVPTHSASYSCTLIVPCTVLYSDYTMYSIAVSLPFQKIKLCRAWVANYIFETTPRKCHCALIGSSVRCSSFSHSFQRWQDSLTSCGTSGTSSNFFKK